MKNISELSFCYGCGVCITACPVSIIHLEENEDGFYEPVIKEPSKCIDCGLCLKVCSFNNKPTNQNGSISAYAAWSNDTATRNTSSSGGIAFELAVDSFRQGYKAIGARYNPSLRRVEHFTADTLLEFKQSIGSKYLQSYTADAFSEISYTPLNQQKWLIVGTPCQIDSLRRLSKIKKAEDRFLYVDFFCHGVPSRLLWLKYLDYISKKNVDSDTSFSWRDKRNGWHDSWAIANTDYFSKWTDGDLFYSIFLGNNCLNKCCYKDCRFKGTSSSADIRIGDFWGDKYCNDNAGVSAVMAITAKGRLAIENIKETCTVKPVELSDILGHQMKPLHLRTLPRELTLTILKSKLPLKLAEWIRRIFNHI